MPPPDSGFRQWRTAHRGRVRRARGRWRPAPAATAGGPEARAPGTTRAARPAGRPDSFFAHFLRAPALVGGIVPSSRALSSHVAPRRGFRRDRRTGCRRRIDHADHPRTALAVIERSPEMARGIARGWPRVFVHTGCVHERADALLLQPARTVAVLRFRLPFRSLPGDLARTTSRLIERFLLAHPSAGSSSTATVCASRSRSSLRGFAGIAPSGCGATCRPRSCGSRRGPNRRTRHEPRSGGAARFAEAGAITGPPMPSEGAYPQAERAGRRLGLAGARRALVDGAAARRAGLRHRARRQRGPAVAHAIRPGAAGARAVPGPLGIRRKPHRPLPRVRSRASRGGALRPLAGPAHARVSMRRTTRSAAGW